MHLISEAAWQKTVVACLRAQGWAVFHDRVAWRSDPGYPDLTAVHHRHGAAWIELKAERGKLSPAQEVWRDTLRAAGQAWYLWRPSDWLEVVAVASGATPGAGRAHQRNERTV